jgi:hypothetical protein
MRRIMAAAMHIRADKKMENRESKLSEGVVDPRARMLCCCGSEF